MLLMLFMLYARLNEYVGTRILQVAGRQEVIKSYLNGATQIDPSTSGSGEMAAPATRHLQPGAQSLQRRPSNWHPGQPAPQSLQRRPSNSQPELRSVSTILSKLVAYLP